jgi:MYXO-CTERM domain-containing protein
MVRVPLRRVMFLSVGGFLLAAPALAAIPVGYLGKPFDPAVAGGAGIVPTTVKAGPYAVPGGIDFVNYDMGGDGVGYHTDAHYTTKDGDGYRSDRPSATLSATGPTKPDLFYDTGTAQDGMAYPSASGRDFYIGSVHPGDWFNYTVELKTAGTYALSSTFSTGNGPPGGEGGDGQMELVISVDGMMMADWKTVFPDFHNKANFHNWKPYPSFATITLGAGPHVIKFQAPFKHLNLDHVQLELVGADGGTSPGTDGGGGTTTGAGGGGAGGTTGAAGGAAGSGTTTGAAGEGAGGTSGAGSAGSAGSAGTSGGVAGNPGPTGAAGASTAGTTGSGTMTGAAGAGPKAPGANSGGGCACSLSASSPGGPLAAGVLTIAGLLARSRRRRRR